MTILERVKEILPMLSLDEKVNLLGSNAVAEIGGVPSYSVPRGKLPTELIFKDQSFAALGCTFDTELAALIGKLKGEVAAEREYIYGGVVPLGVMRSPMDFGSDKFLSEDWFCVYKISEAMIEGSPLPMLGGGVLGSEYSFNQRYIEPRTMHEMYLRPLIKLGKKLGGLVVPGGALNDELVSQSKRFMGLLSDLTSSDALFINEFGSVVDRAECVSTGKSFEVWDNSFDRQKLLAAAMEGRILLSVVDKAAERVLFALFNGRQAIKDYKRQLSENERLDVVARLATESIVLLKNDGALPLPPTAKYGLSGDITKKDAVVFDRGIFGKTSDSLNLIILRVEDEMTARQADSVYALLKKGRVVLALISKKPIELEVDMVLNLSGLFYLPYDSIASLAALADMLIGRASPSGKLNCTWAISKEDYPSKYYKKAENRGMFCFECMMNGYRHFVPYNAQVMFPFGHGLSYGSFEFSKLNLDYNDEKLTASCVVKNIGTKGAEDVVFFFAALTSENLLGVDYRLIGFSRIKLDRMENMAINLDVPLELLSIYDYKNSEWLVPGGKYTICVGLSAQDIRISSEIKVPKSTRYNVGLCSKSVPSYYNHDGRLDPLGIDVEKVMAMPLISGKRPINSFCDKPEAEDKKTIAMLIKKLNKLTGREMTGVISDMSGYAINKLNKYY